MIDEKTMMGAVTLRVADLGQTADFYEQVVGLNVLERTAEKVALGANGEPLVHLDFVANGRTLQFATGLYHLALRVPTRKDLANWLNHYASQDAPYWQGSADHGVSEALYLSDPEGNGIEVYRDRPREQWPLDRNGKLTMFTNALDLRQLLSTADGGWSGIAPETDMGHVHLKAADLTVASTFYVDVIGFDPIVEFPQSALFVSAGGYHHHLGLNVWQSRHAPTLPDDGYGLARYEIVLPDEDARRAVVQRLDKAGHIVLPGSEVLLVKDPFDIEIALRLA